MTCMTSDQIYSKFVHVVQAHITGTVHTSSLPPWVPSNEASPVVRTWSQHASLGASPVVRTWSQHTSLGAGHPCSMDIEPMV